MCIYWFSAFGGGNIKILYMTSKAEECEVLGKCEDHSYNQKIEVIEIAKTHRGRVKLLSKTTWTCCYDRAPLLKI